MVDRVSGHPNYSRGGGAGNFIPELWSPKLVEKFYGATVFGEIANTDYEGEISSHGDKVYIRTRPTVTVGDYERGKDLSYETPESDHVELHIDKGKYFTFKVDSVDQYQADLDLMDEFSDDASEQVKIEIDKDMLGSIYADVDANNQGASAGAESQSFDLGETDSPVELTKDNILDYIVDLGTVLDEQNAPEEGRWLVMPAWACGMIKKSDLKDASLAGDEESVVRNGRIGRIDRFTIYKSNHMDYSMEDVDDSGSADTRAYHMIAGHKTGLTFASQMTDMEDLPNPNQFGRLVRGLQVYGYEVINPAALAHLYAYRG